MRYLKAFLLTFSTILILMGLARAGGFIQGAVSVADSVLSGFSSTTGTISATDTILTAIEKLSGNFDVLNSTFTLFSSSPNVTGTLTVAGIPTFNNDALTIGRADVGTPNPKIKSGSANQASLTFNGGGTDYWSFVKQGSGLSNRMDFYDPQGGAVIWTGQTGVGLTVAKIIIGTMTFSGGGQPNDQALCIASGQLGHCTSAVGVGGGCTCVAP